jgi:hypothetical protein
MDVPTPFYACINFRVCIHTHDQHTTPPTHIRTTGVDGEDLKFGLHNNTNHHPPKQQQQSQPQAHTLLLRARRAALDELYGLCSSFSSSSAEV